MLGRETEYPTEKLEQLCATQSVWTIDLASVLHDAKINFRYLC